MSQPSLGGVSAPEEYRTPDSLRKVLLAAVIGTVVEWFDFVLFGTMAALIFGQVFFSDSDPVIGTLLALATFGSAFVVRPLGSIFFGHIGDRYGRKKALVASLLLMGLATCSIGLLPTYDSVGILAPLLLLTARLLQGFAVGGEYGGAVLIVVERKDVANRRGLYGAWLSSASPISYIMVTLVVAGITASTSESAFNSWGWRIPFLLAGVMVGVGLYIRASLSETELFVEAQKEGERWRENTPLFKMLKTAPLAFLASIAVSAIINAGYYLSAVYGLAYANEHSDLDSTTILMLMLVASVCYFATIMLGGHMSDKVDRRLPMILGAVGFGAWIFAVYPLIDHGTVMSVGLAFVVSLGFLGLIYGPLSIWLVELFDTSVRYTGVSFGYTLATIFGGGIMPTLAAYLIAKTGSTTVVSVIMSSVAALAVLTLVLSKRLETHRDS